jgi:hypothetical protein
VRAGVKGPGSLDIELELPRVVAPPGACLELDHRNGSILLSYEQIDHPADDARWRGGMEEGERHFVHVLDS